MSRLTHRHVVLHDAHEQAADDVDGQDEDAGDGVAAHEFGGTVHGTVEVGFLRDLLAPALGFAFVDQAGVEVGVDRHLLAGHRVQGEACRHFGNPARALGDDDEVDQGEDDEHHQTDRGIATNQEVAEGLDDLARRIRAGMPLEQHDPRRGHVQRQAQQGRHQQHGREHGEIQWPVRIHRHQHHHHRDGDIEGEEHVEQEDRQRQHHHRQNHDDEDGRGELAQIGGRQQAAQIQHVLYGHRSGAHWSGEPGSMPAGTGRWAGADGGNPPSFIQVSSW